VRYIVGSEAPLSLFPDGQQGRLSILNEGPSTVYLEGDSSLTTSLAVPLPPTGIIHWDRNTPLFVKTISGEATLKVTRDGVMTDTSRATAQRIVSKQNVPSLASNGTHSFDSLEVGSYQTLLVRGYCPTAIGASPHRLVWTFIWKDDDGAELYREVMNLWTVADNYALNIPVRGASCSVQVRNSDVMTIATNVNFHATTRALPSSSQCATPVYPADFSVKRGSATVVYTPATSYYLPSWGTQLAYTLYVPSVTVAGLLLVIDMASGGYYGGVAIPVSASDQVLTGVLNVPTSAALYLAQYIAPTYGGDMRLALTWLDYDGGSNV
jgi:hypothetical protein